MTPISGRAEQAILARLSDATYGFNAQLDAIAASYGLEAEDWYLDFSETSENVFVGTDPEDAELEDVQYPNCLIEVRRNTNRNHTRGPNGIFSGDIVARIIFDLPWEAEKLPRISTAPANMVEEAMYACFCSSVSGSGGGRLRIWTPGNNLVWAADMQCDRTSWRTGGPNWLQALNFALTFVYEAR
jgi:hypothetical protein